MAKTIGLIIIGALVVAGLIVAILKWRRSRQHIGIARPADTKGFNDNRSANIDPALVGRKQVIVPGSETAGDSGIPIQNVEDALAHRPGAPEPGQTFAPGAPGQEQGQNPDNPPENPPPAQQ